MYESVLCVLCILGVGAEVVLNPPELLHKVGLDITARTGTAVFNIGIQILNTVS